MTTASHPSPEILQALILGTLAANEAAEIEAHVEACAECEAALVAADHSADPLVAELRMALSNGRTANSPPTDESAGTLLAGRYKLVECIGDGGMGTVWMATQFEPVRRLVAVKLIKAGMDSAAVLARFEAERQALALMDHPNIAKVLDGGIVGSDEWTVGSKERNPIAGLPTAHRPLPTSGRPFFVMELVKGIPITTYCDQQKLTPRQRLELFIPVCQAIQHAHQKGIIHRDIKPSNVLIALYDERPVPKVIDFGVAKAVGQPLTDTSLHTKFGAIVGTPEYMSPEQASFNNLDVDTRSDVYSLGVLLYELLTGGPPHPQADLENVGLLEVLRVVREVDPPRPSHRLSTTEALARLAEARGIDGNRLTHLVRGELDLIVMKCLEKDRNRRYETANGLADDVRRYLAGEPVRAVPPTTAYRIRKFVRKHRGPLAAAAIVFFALAAGIVGTTIGFFRADTQRQIARDAEKVADNRLAQVTAAHADLIWLVSRVTMQLRDQKADAALQSLVQEMGRITAWLDQAEYGDKRQRYGLRFRSGHALRVLEKYPAAVQQLEKALAIADEFGEPNCPEVVGASIELALVHRRIGNTEKADRYRARALEAFDALPECTLATRSNYLGLVQYLREWADEPDLAVRLAEQMLATFAKEIPVNEREVLEAVHHLAWAKLQLGRSDVAATLEREALQGLAQMTGDADKQLFQAVARDAQMLFQRAGHIDDDSFATLRRVFAGDSIDPGVLAVRGHQLLRSQDWSGADTVLRECLARREKAAPDAWTTFNTRSMLGASRTGQKRHVEAEPLLLEGYRGINDRKANIPPGAQVRLTEAVERLIAHYEAIGNPAEMAKWSAELASLQSKPPPQSPVP